VTTGNGWGDEKTGKGKPIVRVVIILQCILLVRGEKVIPDSDVAQFYGVTTRALNQALRRNRDRLATVDTDALMGVSRSTMVTLAEMMNT
jgi:hypothetical protein